jgi:hypothetical protein
VQSLIVSLVAHCSMDKRPNKVGKVNMTSSPPEGLRRGTRSAVAHPTGDEQRELGDGRPGAAWAGSADGLPEA